ncbi:MAG TPA: hypothetical protein VHA82_14475 [Ramlibacter sp.]|uniref:hypothetical protein n=1 Tax=Ramlibacter sp. TaxID=1917967 RepID=UPI002C15F60B|nr:hypothetical protein [Ramlibacter sp.]HVZ45012.1 hypothetical protein [Ramlibacter sp.]
MLDAGAQQLSITDARQRITPPDPSHGGGPSPACMAGLPSFSQLTRCTWGTHVTVRGQPAKFHQAGLIEGCEIVIVLAGGNDVLAAACRHKESACLGEVAYYFDYARAGLSIGTPSAAPLLREQAATCLRAGDTVALNGSLCTFLESKRQADELWLTLRTVSGQEHALHRLGADCVDDRNWGRVWRVTWRSALQLHLASTRLPTFAELAMLDAGTLVTLGSDAQAASMQGTQLRDGTKQFVLVEAAPWLNLHQADSELVAGSRNWVYRIRFEEAGLRLAEAKKTAERVGG